MYQRRRLAILGLVAGLVHDRHLLENETVADLDEALDELADLFGFSEAVADGSVSFDALAAAITPTPDDAVALARQMLLGNIDDASIVAEDGLKLARLIVGDAS